MGLTIIHAPRSDIERLAELAVLSLPSPSSRRVYAYRLREFIKGGYQLTREGIAQHIADMRGAGASYSAINQAAAATRKLVEEAETRGLIDRSEADGIYRLKLGRSLKGNRSGNWLTIEGVRTLLGMPQEGEYHGLRDRALLGLLVGCGLRRAELADLEWDRYQSREGRMCLVDIQGKGGRVRTIPVPSWVSASIDTWRIQQHERRKEYEGRLDGSGATDGGEIRGNESRDGPAPEGRVPDEDGPGGMAGDGEECVAESVYTGSLERESGGIPDRDHASVLGKSERGAGEQEISIEETLEPIVPRKTRRKEWHLVMGGMGATGVWWVVKGYAARMGVEIAPHDLRRTLAKLMRKAGAELEQIRETLGHSSLGTTERYLGTGMVLEKGKAGVDLIQMEKEQAV